MAHTLPELPYAPDALQPVLSEETLQYHYGKHHQGYVNKLNAAIEGTEWEDLPLETLIQRAEGSLFNNAAQTWNHTFYWNGLSPDGGGRPEGKLADALGSAFGDFDGFRDAFKKAAAGNFGSGWTWLVRKIDGRLDIVNTSDAGNPMTAGDQPLFTVDVWEHAYYIDYRNGRADYLDALWDIVNWDFIATEFGKHATG
ncbi:MAG: superoxide dismutase [Xanthomonadales bacterium]|nr:superoxide dismutase [Xanthomonadales bacterium]